MRREKPPYGVLLRWRAAGLKAVYTIQYGVELPTGAYSILFVEAPLLNDAGVPIRERDPHDSGYWAALFGLCAAD